MIGRTNAGLAPLKPKYSIKGWCATIGLAYADLSDITEPNMRILMSKHASVDYFMEWYASDNAMLDIFTQNAFAMKWIGLNDYIADKLLAISDAESRLLASEYWPYILKDKVPIMTANDAPYGEASASSVFNSYLPYIAFDGTTNSWLSTYRSTSLSTPIWIKYKFTNPICIKKSRYKLNTNVNTTSVSILFEVSNDDVNWTPLGTSTDFNSADFSNDSYFLYIRTTIQSGTSAVNAYWGFESLQFYGRSLNDIVPPMFSDSQSGFVASASRSFESSSQFPYKMFDKNVNTPWSIAYTQSVTTSDYAQLMFDTVRKCGAIKVQHVKGVSGNQTFKVVGIKEDDTTIDLVTCSDENTFITDFKVFGLMDLKGIRVIPISFTTYNQIAVREVTVYGVDYSDRTERTYLYDHGVDVVPTQTYVNKEPAVATKEANRIKIVTNNAYAFGTVTTSSPIDLSPYKLLRCTCDDELSKGTGTLFGLLCAANSADGGTSLKAWSNILEKECSVDISSVNESQYISILGNVNSAVTTVNEIWLE